jgi:cell division protein ZapA
MASVTIEIGGNPYNVSCRDGEEPHLRTLAAIVDAKAIEARGAVGGVSEVRQLLLASLLLADELNDARKGAPLADALPRPAPESPETATALAKIADYAESLATRLENVVKSA